MKIFKSKSFFIILSALLFFIVNEIFSYYIGLEKDKFESYKNDEIIFSNLTSAQAKNIELLAKILAVDKNVIKAYKEDNPKIIKEHISPVWEKIKDEKLVYEIHFFKPPAVSFVNFSNFKSINDDVSKIRTDIKLLTSSFKPSTHTLICTMYAGLRATEPIIDENGKMLGGLSLGKKIDWIPESIKEATKHDSFLVYKKESISNLTQKNYNDFIKDKKVTGKYILANKTIDISTKDIKNIDFTKKIQEIKINNEEYTLYIYHIIDFNKNTIAYLCTLTQLKDFKNGFTTHTMKNFILILITTILIFLATRKKTIDLLKEIKNLKNITKKIKKRDFSILHNYEIDSKANASLVELEQNIIEMGLELEKQYIYLKDDNRKKTKQLIEQLYSDELTGLANRNALFKDLNKNKAAFVSIFNIRGFKEINDAFGFEAGNYILQELANKYKNYAKDKGFEAYRVGSDEFVIINTNNTLSKNEFMYFINSILDKIEHTSFHFKNDSITVTININMYTGICFEDEKRLEKADRALTQAKKEKKSYVIYNEDKNNTNVHLNNIKMISKITNALKNDNIIVFYQAIVNENKQIKKYEALVRMRDENDIISPFHFLDISKRTRHYNSITKVVIEKTFEKFKNEDKRFSINLTADDIINEDTVNLINKKLSECKDPTQVVFELVESDDLSELSEIEEFITNIKKIGAKIAIDDFGTGYSNFSYMIRIKPDFLKIDGSLITNINSDENAYKIVQTIVSFCKKLNIKTIAEFVHSEEIFEICKNLGIDEFQGYYFSEPKEEL